MNVQLLLLLALAGPFCAFTHASPTGLPVTDEPGTSDQPPERLFSTVQAVIDDTTMNMNHVVTGPPTTAPETAPAEATNAPTMPAAPAFTTEQVVETDAPVPASTAAPQPLITDPPAVETAAPTDPATAEDQTQATGAAKIDTGDDVVVEGDTVDGLSSGQVVGIVIGALLAVVIVIAVVIAVVRRMGKYSSAKKKPAKKDSAMVYFTEYRLKIIPDLGPLRRKSAKQQERSKFWKF